jgi:hypothetical protein
MSQREMEKWENLKVYRNLPPDEVPKRFKEFAQLIMVNLEGYGFKLTETKTLKKLYRINSEFEQSIHFDNSSRWAANQKDIGVYIGVKPLYADKEQSFRIFEAFQIDPSFKRSYPLTREFRLLAENITEKIQKHILPFLDSFSTSEKIVRQSRQLIEHNKTLNTDLQQLLYECAFLQRDKSLFGQLNAEYLNERIKIHGQFNHDSKYALMNLKLINRFKRRQQIFDDNELYRQEIISLNEKSKKYLDFINKHKPIR